MIYNQIFLLTCHYFGVSISCYYFGVSISKICIKNLTILFCCIYYRSCYDCMTDLDCGYCYIDGASEPRNSSCLQSDYDYSVKATVGRCNSTHLAGSLTWAYDFCPTPYAWMPMVGLVMYVVFFAPGEWWKRRNHGTNVYMLPPAAGEPLIHFSGCLNSFGGFQASTPSSF